MPDQNPRPKLLSRLIIVGAVVVGIGAMAVLISLRPWTPTTTPRVTSVATGAGTPPPAMDKRQLPAPPAMLFGRVLVNDSGSADLGRHTAVFVQCVIDAHAVRAVSVAAAGAIRPVVVEVGRGPVAVEWESLPSAATSLPPGQTMTLTWIASTPLRPGSYEIAVPGIDAILGLRDAGLTAVRIDPAMLTVGALPGDPRITAHYGRRALALRGRTAELIAALEAGLKADPDNLALARELVDAFELANQQERALHRLEDLALGIQARQARARPGMSPDLPDWVVFRLGELGARPK